MRSERPLEALAACADTLDIDGYKRIGDIGVTHTMMMLWYIYGGGDTVAGKCDAIKRFGDDVIAWFEK